MKFPIFSRPASVLLAAMLAVQAVSGAENAPDKAKSAGGLTPEKVQAAVSELDKLAEQTLKKTGVPGMAVAVVYKDEVVLLKGYGVRQVGKPEAVDADTVFQLASVSKSIASTVLAALVGEGTIGWDDLVIDHDPGFEMYDSWVTRQLTLRDLLCHRSGLPDHGGDVIEDLGYDRGEVLHRLRFLKPASSFRSHFAYTNFGFSEAAVAAARGVGKSWEDLAKEKLYQPLGMKSTSSRYDDYAAAKNRAVLHARVGGQWVAKFTRNADAQAPAGGASSTVRDMAQWLRLQLADGKFDGKQLIAADALAETHRPQIISHAPANSATDRASFYGLGWNVNYDDHGRVRLNHSGGFDLGAATVVNLVPSEELGIVVLTNGSPVGVPEALGMTFCDLALDGKAGKDWFEMYRKGFEELSKPPYGTAVDYRKPPERASPPLAHAAYLGTYGSDLYGELEVAEKAGSLTLRMGPKMNSYPMQHWDRDVFLYQPTGEMAAGPSAVTFTVGADQKATQVVIENLDVTGQGTFVRVATKK